MEDNFSNYFNQTGRVAKEYLETRLDLIKLQAAGKLSRALGLFFSLMLASLLFFFVVVFLGMVVGFWIGEMTHSYTIGFSCSAGLFVFLLAIMLLFRRPLIQRPLSNMIITELMSELNTGTDHVDDDFLNDKEKGKEEEEEAYEQL
jgi:hypothetical protein